MARKVKQSEQKQISIDNTNWTAQQLTAQSDVHLEDDPGEGGAAIIRMFRYTANPEAFKLQKPTKQELFNSCIKGIEALLWKDGLKPFTDSTPKITINKKGTEFRIFIAAIPQKGHMLTQVPQTLSEVAHSK